MFSERSMSRETDNRFGNSACNDAQSLFCSLPRGVEEPALVYSLGMTEQHEMPENINRLGKLRSL
jgi:hypothetical protein